MTKMSETAMPDGNVLAAAPSALGTGLMQPRGDTRTIRVRMRRQI